MARVTIAPIPISDGILDEIFGLNGDERLFVIEVLRTIVDRSPHEHMRSRAQAIVVKMLAAEMNRMGSENADGVA